MLFAAAPDTNIAPLYKCGTPQAPSICYATDPRTDQLFKNTQKLVNYYSARAGFAPIVADGFIGDATINALKKVAIFLASTPTTGALGVTVSALTATKEQAAQSAVQIHAQLESGIRLLSLPPVSSPSPSVPSRIPNDGGALPVPPPPPARRPWVKYAIGVGVLATAGFVAWRLSQEVHAHGERG